MFLFDFARTPNGVRKIAREPAFLPSPSALWAAPYPERLPYIRCEHECRQAVRSAWLGGTNGHDANPHAVRCAGKHVNH